MELKQYFRIVRRWAWLLIVGLILGASGGFLGSSYQTPVYQASTRLLVMRAPQEKTSDYTYLSDQQLIQTYLQLVTTTPVLDAVSETLGYEVDQSQLSVQQMRDTQVIQLTVEDGNAERAATIANALVEKLVLQNEALQAGRFTSTEANLQEQIKQMESQISGLQTVISQITTQNLNDQMAELEAQITPLQDERSRLEQEIAALEPAYNLARKTSIAEKQARISQIDPLLSLYQEIYSNLVVLGKPIDTGGSDNIRLAQLQTTLELYQGIYINLLNSLESIRLARLQNTPNIVQIEPAATPSGPIRPRPLQNTLLAGAVGLMLAAGIVFLIEYLDDTLKTPEDVERALGIPVLGFVAEMQDKNKSAEDVYVSRQPRSPISEAFRSLRTNLEFASVQKPIRTILVTSPGPAEGKTTVAVNLAAIIALSGKRVALVDADMRRPCVHRLLGLPNRGGLSNLFRSQDGVQTVSRNKLELPNLKVITSGGLPPNPAELLGSERMGQILDELCGLVDMVVIDTPPSMVADAQILAGKVDAVLLVIQPGKTQTNVARSALELFNRTGARVIGIVLNRIPRNRDYYYGGYQYYSPYGDNKGYYSREVSEPAKSSPIESDSNKLESDPTYSFLNRAARLSTRSEELPPPDPPRQ